MCAVEGKGFGIILLEKGDEAFADEAAEIESGGGVVGAHDGAELHSAFGEVGDLKSRRAAIPEFCVLEDAMEFLADRGCGGRTIAESAQTAIIFGMPNEAIKTGCVDQVLPLSEIPRAIEKLCQG